VLREWLVNLGRRPATQRIAHLFCELHARLSVVGWVSDENAFNNPFTQTDLADTLGLSDVHVNCTLREVRARGLVTLKRRILTIVDVEGLQACCGFTPNYLHLQNSRWKGRRDLQLPPRSIES
jgi:CRP-like cAMP-binding protein